MRRDKSLDEQIDLITQPLNITRMEQDHKACKFQFFASAEAKLLPGIADCALGAVHYGGCHYEAREKECPDWQKGAK